MYAAKQKAVLRQGLLLRRKRLATGWTKAASNKILASCLTTIDWPSITAIHTYVPIAGSGEVDTWPLLRQVWREHHHIATFVPVILHGELISVKVDSGSIWQAGKYGIPEPQVVSPVNQNATWQAVIVPVVGFDDKGYRLGYGTGYYDRFLIRQPGTLTIGLAYQSGLIDEGLPREPHDVPLKMIITEQSVYDFRRQTSNLN